MKVALVAHHANPTLTSEPLIGWRWAKALSFRCDLTLITHIRNRDAIERARLCASVLYVDSERSSRLVNLVNNRMFPNAGSVNRLILETAAQWAFDRGACRFARRLIKSGRVEVIHRVSPISPRYPSRLGRLGVPFVIGPVNGGHCTPPGFTSVMKNERAGFLRLRRLARLLDPFASTMRSADAIFVANETARQVLPSGSQSRAEVVCENAVQPEMFQSKESRRPGGRLHVLFLGRLLHYKGLQFLLRAIRRLPQDLVHLDVVGAGDAKRELQRLTRTLGLEAEVSFHGAVPQRDTATHLANSDLLVLPSVRESGGAVILEAMAAGLPVVAANHGGPAETIPPGAGILLPCPNEETLVRGLVRTIRDLAASPERRERMGQIGRRHTLTSETWQARATKALETYERVVRAHRSPSIATRVSKALRV